MCRTWVGRKLRLGMGWTKMHQYNDSGPALTRNEHLIAVHEWHAVLKHLVGMGLRAKEILLWLNTITLASSEVEVISSILRMLERENILERIQV